MPLRTLAKPALACVVALCALGAQSPTGEPGSSHIPNPAGNHKAPPVKQQPPPGNVEVSVPYAALSPTDGLPATLARGRTYNVNIPAWVASNGAPGIASVRIGNTTCARNVRPGTTIHLTCTFVVRTRGPVAVTAAVRLVDGAYASQTYHHNA